MQSKFILLIFLIFWGIKLWSSQASMLRYHDAKNSIKFIQHRDPAPVPFPPVAMDMTPYIKQLKSRRKRSAVER